MIWAELIRAELNRAAFSRAEINRAEITLAALSRAEFILAEFSRAEFSWRSEVSRGPSAGRARPGARQGVRGVPFFVVHPASGNGEPVAFSGAQPSEVIAEVLAEQAAA